MNDVFRFLNEYDLRTIDGLHRVIDRFTVQRFNRFSERYIELARNRDVSPSNSIGMTDIYPDSSTVALPLPLIKQLSIYIQSIYIHDPILKFSEKWLSTGLVTPNTYLQDEQKLSQAKSDFYQNMQYILKLKPLIDEGIIILISESIAPSNKGTDIYVQDFYSPDGRADQSSWKTMIPASLETYADEHLNSYYGSIKNGKLSPNYDDPIILDGSPLRGSDKICLQFQDDPVYFPYHMSSVTKLVDEAKIGLFYDKRDNIGINPDIFYHWLLDKRYEVTAKRVDALLRDIALCTKLGASFATDLRVSKDLAFVDIRENPTTNEKVFNALVQMELPYFENATLESIAKARKNETSFINFVSSLENAFKEVNSLTSSATYQQEVEAVFRDTLVLPIKQIEDKLKSLFRESGLLTIGTLSATIAMSSFTLFSEAVALALTITPQLALLGTYKGRYEEIPQMPSFFYWEATKKK